MERSLCTVIAFLAAAVAGAQSDGVSLMREGNRLARSGAYETALLRYREAAASGLDTPLLHYNSGVAYFKLGRYEEAAPEFDDAAADPRLAPLAFYNRGLAERATGDLVAALGSFRLAAARADQPSLERLVRQASDALEAVFRPPASEGRGARREGRADAADDVGELELIAAARIGHDDNVYRTPSDPYLDLSDPARPLVTPRRQAARYMPVDLLAEYVLHGHEGNTDFVFGYRLDGDFYDDGFSNANRLTQTFEVGANIERRDRDKTRAFRSSVFLRDHDERNFDPDDGLDREIDGADVSDRFAYTAGGIDADLARSNGAWRWGIALHAEGRQYESVPVVADYDHLYYSGSAFVEYAMNRATLLSVRLRRYTRDYETRPARDLNGDLLAANPAQRYEYAGLEVGFDRQLARRLELELDYLLLERTDEFVGYHDYMQNALSVRLALRATSRFDVSIAAVARVYDYPNAFAFNDPTAGGKELESLDGSITARFRIGRNLSLWGRADTTDVTSSDPRAAYQRGRSALGVVWRR